MEKKTTFRENVWVALALAGMSFIFVSTVGYFDEGNYRIFAGFWDYLMRGGIPPLSDYVLWTLIFVVLGLLLFHLQSLLPSLRNAFAVRLMISVLAIPMLVLGLLTVAMA